jgi:flagellar biosynthesis GTPase FlhF
MKKEEKVNGAFVGIDEKYIPNNTEDKNTYVKENKGTKRAVNIYLIVFAIFFILIFGTTIFGMVHVFSTMNKMEKDFKEDKSSTIEEVKETQKEMINNAKETQNNIQQNNEQVEKKVEDKTEEKNEKTKTNNNKTTTQESSTVTQKELEEDAEKFQNGSDEDRQEVIDKYEDKAREELKKSGYDYDQIKEDAQRKADELRKQYGY